LSGQFSAKTGAQGSNVRAEFVSVVIPACNAEASLALAFLKWVLRRGQFRQKAL
jgi:hypothetical protein